MAWSWVIYSFLYKKLVIVSTILGKKYILRQAVRKINFPHMWWIFPWGKLFFHTLSLIKGCEEKKSKCVENGHYPVEKTRKIQEMKSDMICILKSYLDKTFYCLALSNLAHRVTICNMAWLLHFLTVGDIFSWLEERAYYCNAVVAHCGLFFQKSPRKHISLLNKPEKPFFLQVLVKF